MNPSLAEFRMPTYREIPNVGLYLEQTVKYINECMEPLGVSITASMLSNYVKQGYVSRPVRKQYYAEHIAYLLFIVLAKQVLSMDNIATLFELLKKTSSAELAYAYFCNELENMLHCVFTDENRLPAISEDMPFGKKALRSVIIAISQIIYLGQYFQTLSEEDAQTEN